MRLKAVMLVSLGMRRRRDAFSGASAHDAHESPRAVGDDALCRQCGRLGRRPLLQSSGFDYKRVVFARRPVDRVHVRARRLGPGRSLPACTQTGPASSG
jgi:hypothetical protein